MGNNTGGYFTQPTERRICSGPWKHVVSCIRQRREFAWQYGFQTLRGLGWSCHVKRVDFTAREGFFFQFAHVSSRNRKTVPDWLTSPAHSDSVRWLNCRYSWAKWSFERFMNIKRVELTSKAHPYANERLTCKREYAFFGALSPRSKSHFKISRLRQSFYPNYFCCSRAKIVQ